MVFSVTHELRREWAFFLPADHFWGFFVAIYEQFSVATDTPLLKAAIIEPKPVVIPM